MAARCVRVAGFCRSFPHTRGCSARSIGPSATTGATRASASARSPRRPALRSSASTRSTRSACSGGGPGSAPRRGIGELPLKAYEALLAAWAPIEQRVELPVGLSLVLARAQAAAGRRCRPLDPHAVYNERATAESAIAQVLVADLPVDDFELVIVDDHSVDGTREWLLARSSRRTSALLHDRNRGKGAAIATALRPPRDVRDDHGRRPRIRAAEIAPLLRPLLEGKAAAVSACAASSPLGIQLLVRRRQQVRDARGQLLFNAGSRTS